MIIKKKPEYHNILPKKYYLDSIEYILQNDKSITNNRCEIIYFCEDGDIEVVETIILNIKSEYNNISFIKVNYLLKDWEQILLMSLCKHNIIANSTFSWWGRILIVMIIRLYVIHLNGSD